jgi:hypothetical protein
LGLAGATALSVPCATIVEMQNAHPAHHEVTRPLLWRPRAAAAGGRPQAGLEFVEKLLTRLTSTDTTERNARMLRLPLVASLIELPCRSPRRLGSEPLADRPASIRPACRQPDRRLPAVRGGDPGVRLAVDDPELREHNG